MTVIALGADHAGRDLKETLKAWLIQGGYEILDFGTHSPDSVDYPDYALQVGESVASGKADRGLLVCGTGIGMAMAANKVPGVRAAHCSDLFGARLSREHNDANVLTLGGRLTGKELALEILDIWLRSSFSGERHARRIAKVAQIERHYLRGQEG